MKQKLFLAGISLTVFSLFAGIWLILSTQVTPPVAAQSDDKANLRTIQVSGQGQVAAEPDIAIVRLGVQTEADTAVLALEENSDNMTAVISATLEADIAENDIRTEGFRLEPIYESSSDEQPRELVGYRASNMVRVTVRDLALLGELLDTAVAAGSNTIEGIQFEISEQAELEAAAREAAMLNALEKAEQLTELAGAELGPVQTILETSSPRPLSVSLEEETLAAASVPIQAGSQMIRASVQVTWEVQE